MKLIIYFPLLMLIRSTVTFAQAGTLDNSFAGDGLYYGESGTIYALAIQPDGKIIAAGGNLFDLARYHTGGYIDNSFGQIFTDIGMTMNLMLPMRLLYKLMLKLWQPELQNTHTLETHTS